MDHSNNDHGSGAEGRDAVRAAEQTVSDAWIGRLLLAESEAGAVLGACARVRRRAADRVREAQRGGDVAALARTQTELDIADAAQRRALETHERHRVKLAHELTAWSEALACRLHEARADGSAARWR